MPDSLRPPSALWPTSITPRAALLATFCCLIWSGAYVTGKFAIGVPGLPGFGPFRAAFLRFAISGTILFLWGLWRDPESMRVKREDWRYFGLAGLLGICLTYAVNYTGLAMSSGTAAALITATEPVWIAILAVLFLRERLTKPRIVGVVFGLAGAVIVVASTGNADSESGPGGATAILGNVLMVLSLLFESAAVLTAKRLTARYKGRVVVTFESLAGAVLLAPFAAWENHANGPLHPSVAAWGSFLYLVIGCTLVTYTLWYHLMETTDASELTVFIFLQPVLGTLIGVALFHDALTIATIIGAALVVVALVAITRQPKPHGP